MKNKSEKQSAPALLPTPGRIVNYVLGSGPSAGQVRPAVVTRIVNPTARVIALQVFTDNENDGFAHNLLWRPEVTFDARDKQGNTWHWPKPAEDPASPAS